MFLFIIIYLPLSLFIVLFIFHFHYLFSFFFFFLFEWLYLQRHFWKLTGGSWNDAPSEISFCHLWYYQPKTTWGWIPHLRFLRQPWWHILSIQTLVRFYEGDLKKKLLIHILVTKKHVSWCLVCFFRMVFSLALNLGVRCSCQPSTQKSPLSLPAMSLSSCSTPVLCRSIVKNRAVYIDILHVACRHKLFCPSWNVFITVGFVAILISLLQPGILSISVADGEDIGRLSRQLSH